MLNINELNSIKAQLVAKLELLKSKTELPVLIFGDDVACWETYRGSMGNDYTFVKWKEFCAADVEYHNHWLEFVKDSGWLSLSKSRAYTVKDGLDQVESLLKINEALTC